jgi:hypothetical protein
MTSYCGPEPQEIGARLFKALFPNSIRLLLERSLEAVQVEGKGLRIKIFFNPREPALRFLQGLPWELLFREETAEFFALSEWTPIVRSLAVPQSARTTRISDRLRVLAARSLPKGATVLDLEKELVGMKSANEIGRVEIVPWSARLLDLRETLHRRGPFDVLHFLGHGEFLNDSQEGVLVFETPSGTREFVRGTELAEKLRDFRNLRLVVLNACKSALSSYRSIGNPFGGVAAALVQAGLPAVLAMQEVVQDDCAIALSRAFYRTLASGQPIEVALTEGRQAVFDLYQQGFDWAIPCLFLRTSPSREPEPRDNRPEDEITHAVQLGIKAFRAGNYEPARRILAEVLTKDPDEEKALLFDTIARIAMGSSLPIRAILEIDSILQRLMKARDREVADIAHLALGILRHDIVEPRYIRSQGIPSLQLFADLGKRRSPNSLEQEIARAMDASRDARVRFKILN